MARETFRFYERREDGQEGKEKREKRKKKGAISTLNKILLSNKVMPLKIYKPKHVIKESENVGVKEIPLAFINADDNECAVEIRLEEPFAKDGKRRIEPYEEFTGQSPHA